MIRSLVRILAAPGSGNCSIVTNTLVHTENDGKTRVGCQGKLFFGLVQVQMNIVHELVQRQT